MLPLEKFLVSSFALAVLAVGVFAPQASATTEDALPRFQERNNELHMKNREPLPDLIHQRATKTDEERREKARRELHPRHPRDSTSSFPAINPKGPLKSPVSPRTLDRAHRRAARPPRKRYNPLPPIIPSEEKPPGGR